MNKSIRKIQRLSNNQPTYQAYPTTKRGSKSNQDTIDTDTVERSVRLNIDKTSNSSLLI